MSPTNSQIQYIVIQYNHFTQTQYKYLLISIFFNKFLFFGRPSSDEKGHMLHGILRVNNTDGKKAEDR